MRDRTWNTLILAALLGPAVLITGCQSDGHHHHHPEDEQEQGFALAEPVEILGSETGNSAALDVIDVMLIKTQQEYDALGDADIFPGVDFEENDLVIATLGEQPTGGYGIQITGIQQEGDTLIALGTSSVPAPDVIVTQALTYPYAAVVIANTDATRVVHDFD